MKCTFSIIEDINANRDSIKNNIKKIISSEKSFICDWSLKIIDFEKKIKCDKFFWIFEFANEELVSAIPIRIKKTFYAFTSIYLATNYYGFITDELMPTDFTGFIRFIDRKFPLNLMKCFHPLTSIKSKALGSILEPSKFKVTVVDKNHYSNLNDFNSYWQNRPSNLRQTAIRKSKKIQIQKANFILTSKPTAIEINHYWQIYENSWKPQEPCRDFVDWVLSAESNYFSPHLGILYVDNIPIASQIWFSREQSLYIFKLAQDKQYDKFSPGTLLTKHMAEQLTTHNVKQINFMFGDDEYKKLWMDSVQDIFDVTIYRVSTLRSLANLKQRIRHLIKPTA